MGKEISIAINIKHHGWMKLVISTPLDSVEIDLSSVVDPFSDFELLIRNLRDNIFPNQITIDEEGHGKTIILKPSDDNKIHMIIQLWMCKSDDVVFECIVNKTQLRQAFKMAITRLLSEKFSETDWPSRSSLFDIDWEVLW